jgi:preprotein translocase subunit Sss1
MGSIFIDPMKNNGEEDVSKFRGIFKKARTFDKAYLNLIKTILVVLGVILLGLVGFAA